jgi:hypothetical protein
VGTETIWVPALLRVSKGPSTADKSNRLREPHCHDGHGRGHEPGRPVREEGPEHTVAVMLLIGSWH